MTTDEDTQVTARREFWQAVTGGDADAGRAIVLDQLDIGVAGSTLVTHLLVPTQRAVGLRWQRAQWSVADEHAATAVVDAALAVIEQNVRAGPADGPTLVVVCAESEWHVLPARLAAQLARENGVSVRFLGPSMPADHLRDYLVRLQPGALAVSATMPTSLPGAARSIAAAREVGVPVVVGGGAFGGDDRRARMLQADAWLGDAGALTVPVRHLRSADAPIGQPRWEDFLSVREQSAAVVAIAYARLLDQLPQVALMTPDQLARTREDLGHILDFLASALLVDDLKVMRDFSEWLCDLLQARNVARTAVVASYTALAEGLDGRARAVLRAMAHELAPA